jgi:hypothetical protein
MLAVVTSALAYFGLPPGSAGVVVIAAAGSMAGLIGTTVAVMVRHPQKLATAGAFAMLPFYAIWRVATAVGTLLSLRDVAWRKTSR